MRMSGGEAEEPRRSGRVRKEVKRFSDLVTSSSSSLSSRRAGTSSSSSSRAADAAAHATLWDQSWGSRRREEGRGLPLEEEGCVDFSRPEHWPSLPASGAEEDFRLPRWRGGLALTLWHRKVPPCSSSDFSHSSCDFSFPSSWVKDLVEHEPPPFRRLQRNYYADAAVRNRMILSKNEVPICHCTSEHGCGEECINRSLMQECLAGTCPTGKPFCENAAVQERRFPATEVFRCGAGRGWGLRLSMEELDGIAAGTLIIEYLGEVIDVDQCRERLADPERGHDFYFASLSSSLVLDAGPMGSNARFANHSCEPNCQLTKWTIAGEPRVVLQALRSISPGEELVYNYRADTMDGLVCRQRCLCGSLTCAGTIGGEVQVHPLSEWRDSAMRILSSSRAPKLSLIHKVVEAGRELGRPTGLEIKCLEELASEGDKWLSKWRKAWPACGGGLGIMKCSELRRLVEEDDDIPANVMVEEYLYAKRLLKRAQAAESALAHLLYTANEYGVALEGSLSPDALERIRCAERAWHARQGSKQVGVGEKPKDVGPPPPPATVQEIESLMREVKLLSEQDGISLDGAEALDLVWEAVHAWARQSCRALRIYASRPSCGKQQQQQQQRPSTSGTNSATGGGQTGLELLESRLEEVAGFALMREEGDRHLERGKKAQEKEERMRQQAEMRKVKKRNRDNGILAVRKSTRFGATTCSASGVGAPSSPAPPEDNTSLGSSAGTMTDSAGSTSEEVSKSLDGEGEVTGKGEMSDSDEHTLHCFCRLPEDVSSSKGNRMKTLVKCDDCRKWYHPLCVHSREMEVARDAQGIKGFLCPVCLHLLGGGSDLASGPPPGFYISKSTLKPKVEDLKRIIHAGEKLPIQGIAALAFLRYIYQKGDDWQRRALTALREAETYMLNQGGCRAGSGGGGKLSTESSGEGDGAAGVPAPVFSYSADGEKWGTSQSTLSLPSSGRDLSAESVIVEKLSQLLCEGSLLHVLDTSEVDLKLRRSLWKMVSSLLVPSAVACFLKGRGAALSSEDMARYLNRNWRVISRLPLLFSAVQEGSRLGLDQAGDCGADPVFESLRDALSQASKLLTDGVCAPPLQAASVAEPLVALSKWLVVSAEYGYARSISLKIASARRRALQKGDVGSGEEEQYCICRGADDGTFMLACDACGEWYHAVCVGIGFTKKARASTFTYKCISCCVENGEDYPYKWKCFFAPKPVIPPKPAKALKAPNRKRVVIDSRVDDDPDMPPIQDKKARALYVVKRFVAKKRTADAAATATAAVADIAKEEEQRGSSFSFAASFLKSKKKTSAGETPSTSRKAAMSTCEGQGQKPSAFWAPTVADILPNSSLLSSPGLPVASSCASFKSPQLLTSIILKK